MRAKSEALMDSGCIREPLVFLTAYWDERGGLVVEYMARWIEPVPITQGGSA